MSHLEDLRAILASMPDSVQVVFGSHTTQGLLDYDGQGWGAEDLAQVGVEILTLTYCYPDLPGLQSTSPLTVDGKPYAVTRGPWRKGDGLEAVVILQEEA